MHGADARVFCMRLNMEREDLLFLSDGANTHEPRFAVSSGGPFTFQWQRSHETVVDCGIAAMTGGADHARKAVTLVIRGSMR